VSVTWREFAANHGFTNTTPVEVARGAIAMIGDPLRAAYSNATTNVRPLGLLLPGRDQPSPVVMEIRSEP